MRSSDWSSDVCSSDLRSPCIGRKAIPYAGFQLFRSSACFSTSNAACPAAKRFAASASPGFKIGRESCRDRVCQDVQLSVVAVALKKKAPTRQVYTVNTKNNQHNHDKPQANIQT